MSPYAQRKQNAYAVSLGWLADTRKLVRHPVSFARQRAGVALLVLLVIGLGSYAWGTRNEAIRRRAIAFIEKAAPGLEVSVGAASFEMFGGITLHNVNIAVPYDERLDPNARDSEARSIFSAASVAFKHNPWRLLLGNLHVERITAVEPTIRLTHNLETGLRNWQLLSPTKAKSGSIDPDFRPVVTLRQARGVLISIDANGRRATREELLDADARPDPQSQTAYRIDVRRYTAPIERNEVLFDPDKRILANTPFVAAKTIRLQLPRFVQEVFDSISLEGEVQLRRMLYDREAAEERDTEIRLRRVRCRLPLWLLAAEPKDEAEAQAAQSDVAMHLTHVRGTVTLHGDHMDVDIAGRFEGAECHVSGLFQRVGDDLKNVGFDLRFQGKSVATPEGAVRKGLLENPGLPFELRKFLVDYDPHGSFDLDLRFQREAGEERRLSVAGDIIPRGVSCTARWFKYPLDDVRGVVRLAPGSVDFEDVKAKHEGGRVAITGHLDRATHEPSIAIDIRAQEIPLNSALLDALPSRFQTAWRRFQAEGRVDVHVTLQREGHQHNEPEPPWKNDITVDLRNVSAKVSSEAAPLTQLTGRLEVDGDRVRLVGLAGRYDEAPVRIDGYAVLVADEAPRFEIQVEADGVRFDESLAAALPPEGRGALAHFQPEGYMDLAGTLVMNDAADGVVWDLQTHVYDTSILYDMFPYRINDVSARIAIRPDSISILQAEGRHGDARLTALGDVMREDDGFVADLTIDARELTLDDELRDALPPALINVWEMLEPAGKLRVRTGLHLVSSDEKTNQRHRTRIDLQGAAFKLRTLPLRVSDASGRLIVTQDSVEIIDVRGKIGEADLLLSGMLDLAGAALRGSLNIALDDMSFSEELSEALPDALSQFLARLQPAGRFGLRLAPLRFETAEDRTLQWWFDGTLRLADLNADLGFRLEDATGELTARGSVDAAGALDLVGNIHLDKAKVAGWHLDETHAAIVVERSPKTIRIDDLRTELYDGEATGSAIVQLDANSDHAPYRASFTLRDLQLGSYLQEHRKPVAASAAEPSRLSEARGSLSGSFVLRRKAGHNRQKEGTGEFFIREAQVWKLPIGLAIFQVLNLTPDENVFHDGRLKFFLTGDKLTFQRIDLQGKAVAFIGGGRMDLHTDEIDVTLLAGSPVRIHIPLLTDIVEGASREIMEVRVSGTLSDPRIRPQPLKSLQNALETLFPEAPRSDSDRPVSTPRS